MIRREDMTKARLGVLAGANSAATLKRADEAILKAGALQNAIFNSANFSSIATDVLIIRRFTWVSKPHSPLAALVPFYRIIRFDVDAGEEAYLERDPA